MPSRLRFLSSYSGFAIALLLGAGLLLSSSLSSSAMAHQEGTNSDDSGEQTVSQAPPQTGTQESPGSTVQSTQKPLSDLPPVHKRLIVSAGGLENLGFATPCEPGLLTSVVPGSSAELVQSTDAPSTEGEAKTYVVRLGWEALFRAESNAVTGHIQRLVIWTPNALTPAGIAIGQIFERAAKRTRAAWSFEPGRGEFAGALVGTLTEAPNLRYVFASENWSSADESEAEAAASEPGYNWELQAFIWTAD